MNINKYIIYGLKCILTNEIRYIGKSTSGLDRPREHFKPFNLKKHSHKNHWIKQCLELNKKPEIIIIEEHTNSEDLYAAEAFWISYHRLNGNLTNVTDGFEGTHGYKHNDETKEKIAKKASIRQKGKILPKGMKQFKEHLIINGIESRQCPYCDEYRDLNLFNWDNKGNKFQSYCRPCNTIVQSNWKLFNPSPTLDFEEYNKSRLPGAIAGGEASKRPERRIQVSQQRSKAIVATHLESGTILEFPSALKAKEAGFQNSNIGQAIKFNKPYKNYIWKFVA